MKKRNKVLTRISRNKNGTETKESDHNVIKTIKRLPWSKTICFEATQRETIFNLKNKDCQMLFKAETSNNTKLSRVFDEIEDLDTATEMLMKKLNKSIYKCFKKIGQRKERHNAKHEEIYNRWKDLKKRDDPKSKAEVEALEDELADEYFGKVKEATAGIDCEDGGNIAAELWKLKKQLCPRSRDPPSAMLDKDDNLITNEDQIKAMAVSAYEERLKNRPIKEGLEHILEAKEKLANKLMDEAKQNKTPPWNIQDLQIVLYKLKNNKSRDPNGLVNELFKEEAAGEDLKVAILNLMNRIKN